jgi:heterodisulfide reductase subunit B2
MEYAYYPGCSLEATGRPYDVSLRLCFERLGIGLKEIDDWNCCGATSYISMNKLTGYSLAARNLANAERMGLDVCAPCSSCFTILSKVNRHMRWGEAHKAKINEVLQAAGLSYSAELDVLHPLGILVDFYGIERIQERVVRRLDGLKIAPYYGCQIVRPTGRFDDREDPQQLDNLFSALGAHVVPFAHKVRCCGGMLMTTCEDVALRLNRDLLTAALEAGADVIATTCPLCQMNLEGYQGRINDVCGTQMQMPVVYFSQLLGLALGLSNEELLLDKMVVPLPRLTEPRPQEVHA